MTFKNPHKLVKRKSRVNYEYLNHPSVVMFEESLKLGTMEVDISMKTSFILSKIANDSLDNISAKIMVPFA